MNMMVGGMRFPVARRERVRRTLNVQQMLEWAFRSEGVSLDAPMHEEALIGQGYGIGSSLRLIRRAELGCRIDGGGASGCHEDAEIVAAIVLHVSAGLPMAFRVAEHARCGTTPDWMPDATPRVVPVDLGSDGRRGPKPKSVVVGYETTVHRGRETVHEVRMCPISYYPSRHVIEAKRREYMEWCFALSEIAESLRSVGMLRDHEVSEWIPPREPWKKRRLTRNGIC